MKKVLICFLLLAMITGVCYADAIDWTSMEEELIFAEINNAKAELTRRELTGNTDNITVFDERGVTIVIKSINVDNSDWLYKPALVATYTIVNESSDDYEIYIDNVAINGWEVESMGYAEAAAGHKAKDSFRFNLEDADITGYEELETLELSFHYKIPGTYDYAYTTPINIAF